MAEVQDVGGRVRAYLPAEHHGAQSCGRLDGEDRQRLAAGAWESVFLARAVAYGGEAHVQGS